MKLANWKITFLSLLFATLVSLIFSSLAEISFLVAFALTIFGMVVNGLVADYEDSLPGGLNNPIETSSSKDSEAPRNSNLRFLLLVLVSLIILIIVLYYMRSV